LKFSIAGIFIPGFTAVLFVGFQLLLATIGVECKVSWTIIWVSTSLAVIGTPIWFAKIIDIRKAEGFYVDSKFVIFFYVLEYTFLQGSIGSFLSDFQTLCYGTDGQNGLQFVFTGWIAIPILNLIGLYFDFRQ
jgi:hypothetical protein